MPGVTQPAGQDVSIEGLELGDLNGLELKFGGRLVQHLGAQLYPSATATVAELISNAWDANATRVWVSMPFGDWAEGEIAVVDDGHGMSFAAAQERYLEVGYNRRRHGERTEGDLRLAHGRKGIGKLAAFGTAGVLDLRTRREDAANVAFRMVYDRIRQLDPDTRYQVEVNQDPGELADPNTGQLLPHGTRIRLTELKLRRRLNEQQFRRSMSRRFALRDEEMRVWINGEALKRFEGVDLEFRLPPDAVPDDARVDEDEWAIETLEGGHVVRWWMGFTRKPLAVEGEQGISVLARGKLVQAPFTFRRFQGTEGQLGLEYLVGEVVADWIDPETHLPGDDSEQDVITSNRDALQLEDDRLQPFVAWGRRRVAWALKQRTVLRNAETERALAEDDELQALLAQFPAAQRGPLRAIAIALMRLQVEQEDLVDVIRRVGDVQADSVVRRALADADEQLLDGPRLWDVAARLAEIDARTLAQTLTSRVLLLERLVDETAPPADRLLELLAGSPWLLGADWVSARLDPDARTVLVSTRSVGGEMRLRADAPGLGLPDLAGDERPSEPDDRLDAHLRRSLEEHRHWRDIVRGQPA